MSELYLDTANTAERTIKQQIRELAQGVNFIGGEVAMKTIVTPMRYARGTEGTSTILISKPSISYVIHSVNFNLTKAVTDTATKLDITWTQNGIPQGMSLNCQTLTAETLLSNVICDFITDENTSVQCTVTGTCTSARVQIFYREVQQNAIPR
jgi:hypothetical protein